MPDYFESGFFGNGERAWHNEGTVIPEDVLTAADALALVPELASPVELRPVYFDGNDGPEMVENFNVAVRELDGKVIGKGLSDGYQLVQNIEAFSFMDELLGSGEAKWHTAGTLKGGEEAWMLARIPADVVIGGEESERHVPFLFLRNGFNGKSKVEVGATFVRIVCWNTLRMAIQGSVSRWSVAHRGNVLEGRLQDARKSLELTYRQVETFQAIGDALVTRKMDKDSSRRFFDRLLPLSVKGTEKDSKALAQAEAREAIRTVLKTSPNLANVNGTAWGLYNAVAEYEDWSKSYRSSARASAEVNRFDRIMTGDKNGSLKDSALAILTK